MTSTSAQGVASITLEFEEGTDPVIALDQAKHVLKGKIEIGGQEHFYLEGQAALAKRPGLGQDRRQCL